MSIVSLLLGKIGWGVLKKFTFFVVCTCGLGGGTEVFMVVMGVRVRVAGGGENSWKIAKYVAKSTLKEFPASSPPLLKNSSPFNNQLFTLLLKATNFGFTSNFVLVQV